MPDTVTLSYERARKSATNNPDGFGFAIHTGKTKLTVCLLPSTVS